MLRSNRQIVVQGGPGSGKTWLALEQAFGFANEGLGVLLLCYNVALADQLSGLAAKRKCHKGEVTVRSWEKLARELLNAAGVGWDESTTLKEHELYFGEVVPSLMRQIARDPHLESRFDALVMDEAQDHDTPWPGSESDKTGAGWWEIYWKLLKQKTSGPMAIFYDQDQRPTFRQKERFEVMRLFERMSQPAHVNLLITLRYSLPIFRFLKMLQSEATMSLVNSLRYQTGPPEGPNVEQLYEVEPDRTASKVEEVVKRWVNDGFCQLDEILILSRHGTKAKTSLANHARIGEWPLAGFEHRKAGELTLLSINKAKGLDLLAVIIIDIERFDKLLKAQEQVDYFMGASRARQLLAVFHKA